MPARQKATRATMVRKSNPVAKALSVRMKLTTPRMRIRRYSTTRVGILFQNDDVGVVVMDGSIHLVQMFFPSDDITEVRRSTGHVTLSDAAAADRTKLWHRSMIRRHFLLSELTCCTQ